MKFTARLPILLGTLALGIFIATTAFAQVPAGTAQPTVPAGTKCPDSNPNCTSATVPANNPYTQSSGFNLNVKLKNPLAVSTVQDAIKLLVNLVVRLAIPVIVIFFIWSGMMFIFARGNPEKVGKAKSMFFYTVIGTLLILGAWTITNALIGTVNTLTS